MFFCKLSLVSVSVYLMLMPVKTETSHMTHFDEIDWLDFFPIPHLVYRTRAASRSQRDASR